MANLRLTPAAGGGGVDLDKDKTLVGRDPGCEIVVGDGSEHTLEEVGQNFAVTRERIRQIEAKALAKLRHPSRSRRLRAFLDGTAIAS